MLTIVSRYCFDLKLFRLIGLRGRWLALSLAMDMKNPHSCDRCGALLVAGRCAACEQKSDSTFVHRELVVLAILSAIAVCGFLLTRAAADANRRLRLRDAVAWYDTGQRRLADGRAQSAVRSFRRATAINRDDRSYRMALAAALSAARQDESARQVLLGIRQSNPEDPEVNVQLARLEARRDDVIGTVQFYQSALYGSWRIDQGDARRQVRVELIRYLLAHRERGGALSSSSCWKAICPTTPDCRRRRDSCFWTGVSPAEGSIASDGRCDWIRNARRRLRAPARPPFS
jgi:tetratricopeptide (TPR) repeat protein